MAIPTFASSNPAPAPTPTLPPLTFSANPGQNRMQKLSSLGQDGTSKGIGHFSNFEEI